MPDEITIEVPKGMTEESFLKAIEALSKPPKVNHPKCNTCKHEAPPPTYCKMYSSTCATAVGNHQMPTRYDPKER